MEGTTDEGFTCVDGHVTASATNCGMGSIRRLYSSPWFSAVTYSTRVLFCSSRTRTSFSTSGIISASAVLTLYPEYPVDVTALVTYRFGHADMDGLVKMKVSTAIATVALLSSGVRQEELKFWL